MPKSILASYSQEELLRLLSLEGSIAKTAKKLGMSRQALRNWIKKQDLLFQDRVKETLDTRGEDERPKCPTCGEYMNKNGFAKTHSRHQIWRCPSCDRQYTGYAEGNPLAETPPPNDSARTQREYRARLRKKRNAADL